MTHEQRGKYIMLLCLQHQKGFLTEKDMLKICETYDEDIFCKFEKDGDVYVNRRMKAESDKRAAYAQSRRNNRSNKDKKGEDMLNICSTHDEHMENENVNEDKDINEVKKPTRSKPRARTFEDEIETLKEHYKTLWRQTSDISERDLIVSIIKLIENEHLEAVCLKPEHPTNSDVTRWVQKYTTNDVLTTVRAMENSPKSFKDKKSMRLTLNNWLARE